MKEKERTATHARKSAAARGLPLIAGLGKILAEANTGSNTNLSQFSRFTASHSKISKVFECSPKGVPTALESKIPPAPSLSFARSSRTILTPPRCLATVLSFPSSCHEVRPSSLTMRMGRLELSP